jgi:8-oxo-dGTP diphosphatase
MKARAAIILIENDKIALIERYRGGSHYLVFPGGKIEANETAEFAAARETREELGLEVKIGKMVAVVWYQGTPQYYFLAHRMSGFFGRGNGKEMKNLPESKKGSHLPIWLAVDELTDLPVLPKTMAEFVLNSYRSKWPQQPLIIRDQPPDETI